MLRNREAAVLARGLESAPFEKDHFLMAPFERAEPALAAALTKRGYTAFTPVQSAVIEPQLDQRDLLVSAQTGSGKTVAFGLAVADSILIDGAIPGRIGAPLALIIAPTRELALQVSRELEWLYAEAGAKVCSCVGGMDPRAERRALERGAHIVVGTPGRLRDHITRRALDLSKLNAAVLDEADEMLDLAFVKIWNSSSTPHLKNAARLCSPRHCHGKSMRWQNAFRKMPSG